MSSTVDHVRDLAEFVTASPSSFHAATEGARRLSAAGFRAQDEAAEWDCSVGGHYLVRDGALVAWRIPEGAGPLSSFRVVGSHTDSPTFKLKPHPDIGGYGWQQLGVEVYGGPLLNSWLDRELGLAGRLFLRDGESRLVRTGPLLRIPQLAVHLDRGVNDEGVKLNKQQHTAPVWSVGHPELSVLDELADTVGARGRDVLGYDVVVFDTTPPQVFGPRQEFFASGRLDNLSSVHASLSALLAAGDAEHIAVLAAFDHEEIGSGSRSGAAGPILSDVLTRIAHGLGASVDQQHRALAKSCCLS
ncbi:MAG TPA: M18 family aminopeptidase, partial [Propionibacteriaceae bacterium]